MPNLFQSILSTLQSLETKIKILPVWPINQIIKITKINKWMAVDQNKEKIVDEKIEKLENIFDIHEGTKTRTKN